MHLLTTFFWSFQHTLHPFLYKGDKERSEKCPSFPAFPSCLMSRRSSVKSVSNQPKHLCCRRRTAGPSCRGRRAWWSPCGSVATRSHKESTRSHEEATRSHKKTTGCPLPALVWTGSWWCWCWWPSPPSSPSSSSASSSCSGTWAGAGRGAGRGTP